MSEELEELTKIRLHYDKDKQQSFRLWKKKLNKLDIKIKLATNKERKYFQALFNGERS